MAKFVAISGPSSSGKTSIMTQIMHQKETDDVVFLSDIFSTVWNDLVSQGYFSDVDEINKDPEFLCIFIQRVADYYNACIEKYKDTDKTVFIDGCWLDLAIYANQNMWYNHLLKDVQEGLLRRVTNYYQSIDRLYITTFDQEKQTTEKYRCPFKRYNIKWNRPLEIQYYKMASNMKGADTLPTTDTDEASKFILDDLKKLGYI